VEQITINYDAGQVDSYATAREFVAHRAHCQGRPLKAIAADMDLSPSDLSRKFAQAPGDSRRFTLDDFERYIETNEDVEPVLYLVEKYLTGSDRIAALEAEIARLKRGGVKVVS
jgi:hypothetical protein